LEAEAVKAEAIGVEAEEEAVDEIAASTSLVCTQSVRTEFLASARCSLNKYQIYRRASTTLQ